MQENHYQPVDEEECLECNCYLTGSFGSKCDALTGMYFFLKRCYTCR